MAIQRTYRYVGPKKIADRAASQPLGEVISAPNDVLNWLRETGQQLDSSRCVTATFVVDEVGVLRIADRRSEHVACAGGRSVRSAGEMTFTVVQGRIAVSRVTNQSTGYCPEPESWPAVSAALERTGIDAPDSFDHDFIFRRCVKCGSINIIKDAMFECGACSTTLPSEWNLDAGSVVEQTVAAEK